MRNNKDYLVDNELIEPKIMVFDNTIAQQQIEDTNFDNIDVTELCQDVLDLISQNGQEYSKFKDSKIFLPELITVEHDDSSIPFRGPISDDTTLIIVCLSDSWSPWHGGNIIFYTMSEVSEIIHPSPGRIVCVNSSNWMQIQPPTTSATEELIYLKFFIK